MSELVQVGETSWVHPESVNAVIWDEMGAWPLCLIGGGHKVRADKFRASARASFEEQREVIKKLMDELFPEVPEEDQELINTFAYPYIGP